MDRQLNFIDLTAEDIEEPDEETTLPNLNGAHHVQLSRRLIPNPQGYKKLERVTINGTYVRMLRLGDAVELKGSSKENDENPRDGGFGRIIEILENNANKMVHLRIQMFCRLKYMEGVFEKKLNEVCMIQQHITNDPRPMSEQSLFYITLDQVYRRRKLILTNDVYPKHVCSEILELDSRSWNYEDLLLGIYGSSALVCRWVSIAVFENDRDCQKNKIHTSTIRPIAKEEADNGYGISEYDKFRAFRGNDTSESPHYTMGDAFCGCGGVSSAASLAGLKVVWGFDANEQACQTYLLNQCEATVLWKDVNDFLTQDRDKIYWVSVLHMSPPCQSFSPANTNAGRKDPNSPGGIKDEKNQATFLSVGPLLDKTRPRIATLEQTSGLYTHSEHREYYRSLLHSFTSKGYSVRTRLMDFAEFGLASRRRRLILLASCPGEVLPDFPEPTHGLRSRNLQPFQTIGEALSELDTRNERHNPRPANPLGTPSSRLQSMNSLLNTITCVPMARHPDGRSFTPAELALLMGFPKDFKFWPSLSDSQCIHQIGNAVPPKPFAMFLEKVVEALEEGDFRRTIEMTQS